MHCVGSGVDWDVELLNSLIHVVNAAIRNANVVHRVV